MPLVPKGKQEVRSGPIQFGSAPPGLYIKAEDAKRLLKDVDSGQVREILYLLAGPDPERHTPDFDLVKMYPWGWCKVAPEPCSLTSDAKPTTSSLMKVGYEQWRVSPTGETHSFTLFMERGEVRLARISVCGLKRVGDTPHKAEDQDEPTCGRCRKILGLEVPRPESTGAVRVEP
jgi:hypothetical protein